MWFVNGSQHLYGPGTLKQVDTDPVNTKALGTHMPEVCSSIAGGELSSLLWTGDSKKQKIF